MHLDRREFLGGSLAALVAGAAVGEDRSASGRDRPSRLRHYVVATHDRDFVCEQLYEFLGMPATPKGPGPDKTLAYGFYSTMMRIGTTMLEVVQPARPDFHLHDWFKRRGGDGGYMLVLQTYDGKALAARARAEGLQLNRDQLFLGQHQVQFDEGRFGAFFEFYEYSPEDDWWGRPLTGPYSDARVAVDVSGCDVAVDDPEGVAAQAARVFLGRKEGTSVHFLDRIVRFVPTKGPRGLIAIDLQARQKSRVGDWARIAGVQFRLV
jgi:hypothetical protein